MDFRHSNAAIRFSGSIFPVAQLAFDFQVSAFLQVGCPFC
jgi:hypothetical protein